MSDPRDTLFAALQDEPKPIDGERVLAIAQGILAPRDYLQFTDWARKNGPTLLEMLNGDE